MQNHWLRILIAVIAAEAAPLLLLVALVTIFGPGTTAADMHFAQTLGQWVGPLGGALATLFMAYWALKPLSFNCIAYGALIGLLVAILDAGILVFSGTPFQWLFLAAWIGRLFAGIVGGAAAGSIKNLTEGVIG